MGVRGLIVQPYGVASVSTRPGGETCHSDPTKITRRRVLVAAASLALLTAKSECALAGTGKDATTVDVELTANRKFNAFMSVSRRLTGKQSLKLKTALGTFGALTAQDSGVAAAIEALQSFWQEHDDVLPADLTRTLQLEMPNLAGLPIALISAWYLGHVGAVGAVIAYEDALMFTPVADVLTPPSYCNGSPEYWAAEPPSI